MQAGVLGVVDGSFRVVDSFSDTVTDGDQELQRCLDVERVFSLPSGETAFAGTAAREYRREREAASIDGGAVQVVESPQTEMRHTRFVGVPGEFVAVDSGDGTFAFDLIAAETNTDIDRATLDLDGFFTAHESATPWKAGFYGAGESGANGILHGEDLRTGHGLSGILEDSTLNQVGLSYRYDGADVKMTAARSGYVEVYRPSEFDAGRYLEYLQTEIRPYVC